MIQSRFRAGDKTRKEILKALVDAVGEGAATDNPGVLYSYSGTSMAFPKALPDFVVRPRTVEDVQRVVKIAGKYQVPVTPVASGTQEPGTYPWFGGVVIDTMAMDRIHEINLEGGYAVIEPGVAIGRLANELEPLGYRITTGSFPPGVSALGNYLMTAVNSHRGSGPMDDILGLEVVLADGTVFRTGSAAWSATYKNTGWHAPTNGFPNIKNMFIDSAGTLGVVTRGAVRIYSLGETRALPLAAFDDFPSTLKYMMALARNNVVQHACCWHWTLYTIIDHLGRYGRGAPADVLVYEPWIKPDDRPYLIAVPTIAGFKENVEGSVKAAERLAREHGGRPFVDECKEKWSGAWKFFADHYRDHKATSQFMGGYGEGFPMMPIVIADPRKITGLEEWGLKFLRKKGLNLGLTYYSHVMDQGRAVFLRMTPFISGESTEKEKQKAAETRKQYMEQAYQRYGAVPIRFDPSYEDGELLAKGGGLKKALQKIKYGLDPENIMNSGMSVQMYGTPPKKTAPARKKATAARKKTAPAKKAASVKKAAKTKKAVKIKKTAARSARKTAAKRRKSTAGKRG